MASLEQIEAARNNGKKSKGPVTEEGKARSSRNAIKHGFAGGHHLLFTNERDDLYDEMLADYMLISKPGNRVESDLVENMVAAQWRMHRISCIEASMGDLQLDRDVPPSKGIQPHRRRHPPK